MVPCKSETINVRVRVAVLVRVGRVFRGTRYVSEKRRVYQIKLYLYRLHKGKKRRAFVRSKFMGQCALDCGRTYQGKSD